MPANIAKASTQEVQAQLERIGGKISKAVASEERTGYLTAFLKKKLNDDALTKALAEFVQIYIVRVPVELVKLLNAAEKANGLGKMQPLVDTVENYYAVIRDDEIDKFGVLALLQTSYAVNGLLQGIPRSSWVKPLLGEYFDYPKEYDVYIRSIIGEANMPGLDAMVSEALNSSGLQNSFSGVDPSLEKPRESQKPEQESKTRGVAEDTYPDRPVIVPVQPAMVPQKKMSQPAGESAGSIILDSKFGSYGKVTASLKDGAAAGLAIMADGKLLVLGTSSDLKDVKGLALLRYNPDGSLDNSFGGSGCLTFIPRNGFIYGRAISLQADGKIVLVGYEYVKSPDYFKVDPYSCLTVARLNPDGSYDVGFGNGGWQRITELRNNVENKHAVAVQPDGKIVVAGNYSTNLGVFTVLRLNRDGSPDKTFGNAGFAILGGEGDRVFGLAVQPDGKILAAGTVGGTPFKFAVVRFNANGSLDSGFGGGGIVAIELRALCGNCKAVDLAVQADGKIVAVGGNTDFPVIRLTRNGTLDPTFGSDGVALSSGLEGLDTASAIAVRPDGRIVVAGNAITSFFDAKSKGIYFDRIPEGTLRYDFALVCYNADGSIDNSFGKGGLLTTDFGSPSDCAYAVKVQPDGKIVAAGSNNDACILLARYVDIDVRPGSAVIAKTTPAKAETPAAVNNPEEVVTQAGLMDTAFGDGGLIVDVDNGEAHAITTLRDGKIVIAGQVETGPDSGSADFAVACYNPDGSPDPSFGSGGITTIDFYGDNDRAYALVSLEDGQIVVAGETVNKDNYSLDFALVRLARNGVVDRAFGKNGAVITDFAGASHDSARALAVQNDGKLVAAGYLSSFKDGKLQAEHIAIARYNPDGSLDGRFGKDGKVVADAGGPFDRAYDVAVQKDGNVLVAGGTTAADGSKTSFVLARFTRDGSPDASFGKGGRVTTAVGNTEDTAYALAIRPDGRILAGGYSTGTTGKDAVLVCYDRNGKLDPAFGREGKTAGIFGGVDDCINALVLQADGKILVTGNATMITSIDPPAGSFAMARLNADGSLDATFGNGGLVLVGLKNINCVTYAAALQADGKVVTAGTVYTDSGKKFALARYLCR